MRNFKLLNVLSSQDNCCQRSEGGVGIAHHAARKAENYVRLGAVEDKKGHSEKRANLHW